MDKQLTRWANLNAPENTAVLKGNRWWLLQPGHVYRWDHRRNLVVDITEEVSWPARKGNRR